MAREEGLQRCLTREAPYGNLRGSPMNINLNSQYAVLRSSALDLNQVAKVKSESLTLLSTGSRTSDPASSGARAGAALRLRNAGLRLSAVETGIMNALSYLETQAGVYRQMSSVMGRMSELLSNMRDVSETEDEVENYFEEFSELRKELSSYRMAQFNGRNLMHYLSGASAAQETLPVALSEDGGVTLNITQGNAAAPQGNSDAPVGYFNTLLGLITSDSVPGTEDGLYDDLNEISYLLDETDWGQNGFDKLTQELVQLLSVNQSEQSQLRLNLDRVRERMLGVEAANSLVEDVDVAEELVVLSKAEMQLNGAVATKTQSNVLADSALKLLTNQSFSSPLIREARLAPASASAMFS